MQIDDRVSGAFLVGLGAAAWYGGSLLPPVPGQQVGPSAFPMVVGGGLALCGALIALGIGSSIEQKAEADLAAHSDATADAGQPSPLVNAFKTLLPPVMLLFYVFAVERLGFVPTAALVIFAIALAMGAHWQRAALLAAAAPPVIHLIFLKLLRVPLPPGLLPMPW